ncbi:competence protein CoiA [Nocardia sp. NBC_00416]|uniref:competence protein CoiA n=1 Tax=Nocardia sp. NBC_00416 TaxID=2975991 RepID=UPI002E2367D2
MGFSDQLTVALDLSCGQYVCAPTDPADPHVHDFRRKSLVGDRSLVCAACFTEFGDKVPVVVRARVGGQRRPHFAHPPGFAPVGSRHHPETLWHLTGKAVLAEWALRQPGVVEADTEVWMPRRERRADVRVVFADRREVALEVQRGPLTDAEWSQRHHDYRRNGVVDVWFWHPTSRPHWIVLSEPDSRQHLWTLDPAQRSASVMIGAPHRTLWPEPPTEDNATHQVPHLPPCVYDELLAHPCRLDDLTLTPRGLAIPTQLHQSLTDALHHERELLRTRRQHRLNQHNHPTPATEPVHINPSRTSSPVPTVVGTTGPPPIADPEALAHLRWVRLQNTFVKNGHLPAYTDAPQFRRTRNFRQPLTCVNCSHTLSPDTAPGEIPSCPPAPQIGNYQPPATRRPAAPLHDPATPSNSSRAASAITGDQAHVHRVNRQKVPDNDQLLLF